MPPSTQDVEQPRDPLGGQQGSRRGSAAEPQARDGAGGQRGNWGTRRTGSTAGICHAPLTLLREGKATRAPRKETRSYGAQLCQAPRHAPFGLPPRRCPALPGPQTPRGLRVTSTRPSDTNHVR